ncbi:FAD-binding oxidoreductase [Granulosicoccus antarcticus]|uniref:Putative FAD-linked oxidoreductase n=1 Tax=Granulosicoccus antarcticus IMCC3135 TaxID=1192854 RepID=A0A2Z2NTX8_9GAMM|nr:FAD-binding oxidoreductase [Granulosicoccus antarcticus]ASJ74936.1 putative FAD-linked oxidoreductase [Granulosicoccus antarcticus IMCC3135]
MTIDTLLSQLREVVGAEHVLTGTDVSARATHFWDPAPLTAAAIIRPANTAETSSVLKLCHAAGQSVVTHGGSTGLVEGHYSTLDDIVLSTERMNTIEAVDVTGRTLTVGAGAILQRVQQTAVEAGLQFGLDLGARGSCTIGGNISTNAGGLSVLRYGMTREQVLGLEVVQADGTILSSMNRMMKNNSGYDLKHLFIGSEGTLGVITRAVLRLRPATPAVDTALLAFDSFSQLTQTLSQLSHSLSGSLDAFEVIWQPFYHLNTNPEMEGTSTSPLPRDYALYAIVESRSVDAEQASATFEAAMEQALIAENISDAVIAQSERERENIWHIREHVDVAVQQDLVFVYDISLPIVDMQDYVTTIQAQLQSHWPQVVLYVYGHLADGNLHIMVIPSSESAPSDAQRLEWHSISNDIVYQPLQALGGSISAEHGIGLSKKSYLWMSRTAEEIALMQTLKGAMDPQNILNPGKIIS